MGYLLNGCAHLGLAAMFGLETRPAGAVETARKGHIRYLRSIVMLAYQKAFQAN